MILCYHRIYLDQLFMKLTVKLDVYNDMAKCNNLACFIILNYIIHDTKNTIFIGNPCENQFNL